MNNPENYYIYCNSCMLKRRIIEVYHFRDSGKPFVYDYSGYPMPLDDMIAVGIDFMVLKHYKGKL